MYFIAAFPTPELPGQVQRVSPLTQEGSLRLSSEVLSLSAPPACFIYKSDLVDLSIEVCRMLLFLLTKAFYFIYNLG